MRKQDYASSGIGRWSWRAGLVGAATVTAINEVGRRVIPAAPRLDELGMRGMAKGLRKAGVDPPPRPALFWLTLVGDLLGNAFYYGWTGSGRASWARGAALGLAAGIGAACLPAPLGLGRGPTERRPATRLMTIGWYLAGGLAAAAFSWYAKADQPE